MAEPTNPVAENHPRRRTAAHGRWRMRLLALLFGLILSAATAEVALRLILPLDPRENTSWYWAHPVYRFRHRPHLDEELVWGQPYHVRTNSRGLRENHELDYDPGGRFRVACCGDSFTFGNGVEYERSFVRVMERRLRELAPEVPWEVINLGVSAQGPSLEYLYYREEGRKYGARQVVIAVFCGNDVADDARDKAFRLVDDRLVEVPYRIGGLKRVTDHPAYQWLVRRSQLVVRLRQGYSWVIDHVLARGSKQDQLAAMSDPSAAAAGWPLSRAVWQAFGELVEAEGGTPVFLLLPAQEQVDHETGNPVPDNIYHVAEDTRQRLLQWGAERDWPVVDALPSLVTQATAAKDLYLAGDFHFNERGHEIVGELLAERLAELATSPVQTAPSGEPADVPPDAAEREGATP